MEVVLYFFIVQAIAKCLTYDLEIEGMLRVGDEFLKKLNDNLYESRKIQSGPHPEIKSIQPIETYTGVLKEEKSRKTENEKRNRTHLNNVLGSLYRMKSDGLLRLDTLQVVVNKNLKLNVNISELILKSFEKYSTFLDKYFDSVTVHVGNTELDIELLMLDLVETDNKLLYNIQRSIFNEVVDANERQIDKKDINKATERMFKHSINDKKRQMELICEEHNVCRPFPGFTDYFADLISELLKLSDNRLKIFLNVLNKSLNKNIKCVQQIMNKHVLEKLNYHWSKLSSDTGIIRDLISIMRTVITQRHKVIDTNDVELKNRTTAVKILFDIIDKAFEYDGEEMIAMNIGIVVEALRHWTSRSQDIESIVTIFVKYVFNILKQSISDDTKKEIRILTEIILRGKSKNKSIYNLMTKGSKFVRGEDLHIYTNFL